MLPKHHSVAVFSLKSGKDLVERVCLHLGIAPGRHEEREFEDGEHKIRTLESVRGRDVFVVESLYGDDAMSINDKLVRVLFFMASLRDAGADRISFIAPYLCYSRKDARTKARDPVMTRYMAGLIESAGVDRIVTMDVHNPAAYQNAFRIRTEHLSAAPSLVAALTPIIGEREASVVSPDAGGLKRAECFRRALQAHIERPVGSAFVEKFRSEGVVSGGAFAGDVKDRIAIIVDDLVSSGTTLARAALACRQHGAREVYAAVTHGVFSGNASAILREGQLERIFVVDTIPPRRLDATLLTKRVSVIDSAPLLASAIHRLHTHGSIVELGEA